MTASIWQPGDVTNLSMVTADNTVKTERLAVATAGQTLCNIISFAYAINTGSLQVFINGIRQQTGIDYLETNGTSFTLTSPLEDGDIVDAQGIIGSSGTQTAAASAAQAVVSATQAQNYYQLMQGLNLPSLPLTYQNGGLGVSYPDKATAFTGFSPLTTKGDLIVHNGIAAVRLAPAPANGYAAISDSSASAGITWTRATLSKIHAGVSTALINGAVNYNYMQAPSTVSIDCTQAQIGGIVRFSGQGFAYTVSTPGNVQVNFADTVEYVMLTNTLPQGTWSPATVTYGAVTSLAGVYVGSYLIDANNMMVIHVGSTGVGYVSLVNPTTKVLISTITITATNAFYSTLADNRINVFAMAANKYAICVSNRNNIRTIFIVAHSAGVGFAFQTNTVSTVTSSSTDDEINSPGNQIIGWTMLQTANDFIVYAQNGARGNGSLQLQSINFNTGTGAFTLGTIFTSIIGQVVSIIPLPASNTFLLVYCTTDSDIRAIVLTVTGTTITAGTSLVIESTGFGSDIKANAIPVPGSSTDFLVVYARSGGPTRGKVISVAGSVVTAGTGVSFAAGANNTFLGMLPSRVPAANTIAAYATVIKDYFISGTNIVLVGPLGLQVCTVAGNVITQGNYLSGSAISLVQSNVTGNYYYCNSVGVYKLTVGANALSTSLFYATTSLLGTSGNPFITEQIFNTRYYSFDAGTNTATQVLSIYPIVSIGNNQPSLVFGADGKGIIYGQSLISKYF